MAPTSAVSASAPVVTVTARLPLHCADETSLHNLEAPVRLGPLDFQAAPFVPIAVVFVYRNGTQPTGELIPVERLRRALRRLLDYYPHLTGRFVLRASDQAPQIERLGEGAELVTAQCDASLSAFEGLTADDKPGSPPRLIAANLPDGGNALLPPFDSSIKGMSREPILVLQHTRFACGGVALGLRMRHIACDADGFLQLARDLAELYRGFCALDFDNDAVELAQAPHTGSYLSELHDMTSEERDEALQAPQSLFELAPEVEPKVATSESNPPLPPVTGRTMRFFATELARIKEEAYSGAAEHWVSTFDALTAHVWQAVHRARVRLCESQGMAPSEAARSVPLQFLASVNMREKLELPPRYFPNGVACPVFSLPADQLSDAPLSSVAASVHDGVRSLDPTEVKQALRWVAAQPDKQRVRLRFRYAEGGILVSQWSKFGMYLGTEFDGPPALVMSPFTSISLVDGLVYFVATEEQLSQSDTASGASTGAIDVVLALSDPLWVLLDEDERFRRHRGW